MYNLDQHTDMHKHRDQVITAVPNTAPQTFTFTSPTNGSTATYVGANLQIVFTPSQAKDSDGDILTRNIHVAGPTLDTIIYHTGTSGMITIPSSRLQSNSTYTIDGTITDGIVIVPAANTVTFLTPMSIPGPNNFTQPANNATGVLRPVVFTWTTSQNATQYELMIMQGATTVKDTIISGLTATIPGLNAITTYTSKIRGQNTAGSGDWSPIITFQTADVIPGSNNFTQPANNATGVLRPVVFTWTQSQNATHYELLIMQNGSTVKDTTIYGLTATIPGLEAITQYDAKVRGQTTLNGDWSPIITFQTADVIPGQTTLTTPANGATNVPLPVIFAWTQSQNATHYELLITQNGSTVKDTTIYGLTATIPGLLEGIQYAAKVRGQTTLDGAWSLTNTFTTASGLPYGNFIITPANNATGVPRPVFFEWTQSQNATHYELLIMQNGSTVKDTTIYGLTATIPGLEAITQYEAKVRGQNTSGNSSWSPIVLFETEDLMPGYTEITKPANNTTNVLYPVLFEWTQSQNATHYELLITQNGSTVKDTTIYGLTATIPGLFPNTEYDAKVRGQTTIDGDWSSNTHFKTIDDVGVENPVKKELSVYPNPFTDYINLKTTTENPLTLDIEIYDMSGKLQENLHENLYGLTDTRFDVSRLTPGMYIMNIHAKTNSVSRMFYHIQLIKK